jgi:hypothetical protein
MVRPRPDPPRPSIGRAIGEGWRRALGAPALVAGLFGVWVLAALPFGVVLGPAHWQWRGLSEAVFTLVDPLPSHWSAGWALPTTVAYSADNSLTVRSYVLYPGAILLWLFLAGGALDRLARVRPLRTAAFSAACGVYFLRFLRLAALFWLIYRALTWVPVLLAPLSESSPTAVRVLIAIELSIMGLIVDFAMVRMVVEDRRSAIGALLASVRFVRRHMLLAAAVFAVNAFLAWAVVALWVAVPFTIVSALVVALLRVIVMLVWMASEIALFQDSLAHAGYTAAPPAAWPESASVEAIRNLPR